MTKTCSTPGSLLRWCHLVLLVGPSKKNDLAQYLPSNVLVTGFDIIFFLGRAHDHDDPALYRTGSF